MKVLFDMLDESGDGRVNFKEFTVIMTDPTVRAWCSSMEIDTELGSLFTR